MDIVVPEPLPVCPICKKCVFDHEPAEINFETSVISHAQCVNIMRGANALGPRCLN